jgi:superfamily II DNA/RNA helicase
LIENEDIKEIEDNINKGKIRKIHIEEFSNQFLKDLISDYESFKKIKQLWQDIDDYPKEKLLIKLINKELRNKKIIIFTEFVDTANYLYKTIKENCTDKVLMFTGKSSRRQQQKVIDNFDANKKKNKQHNEYNILISTDVLSHGVNLHRSNIIINYDIPWNPTKIMQRIGRVQRLGTEFDDINIYNFFPVDEIENTINLKQQAQNKINAFIQLLGTDAKYLTNEQVKTHDLFKKINEEMYDDEGENELQYLMQIREIRDEKPELYDKIKSIPPKIKISRKSDKYELITLLKSDNLKSIIKTSKSSVEEIDFFTAARYLNAEVDEVGLKTNIDYYELLDKAYDEFTKLILKKTIVRPTRNELKLQEYIKYALQDRSISANEQIDLLDALNVIKQGKLTKKEVSTIKGNIEDNNITTQNIIKEVEKIDVTKNNQNKYTYANKEIILSEYFRDD